MYLTGIKTIPQLQGINLFSAKENTYIINQLISAKESSIPNIFIDIKKKESILNRDWKLIINNDNKDGIVTKELYDLKKDYGETVNLIDQNPGIASTLQNSLNSVLSVQPVFEQKNNQPFPTWIDEKQRKKLIETGYF